MVMKPLSLNYRCFILLKGEEEGQRWKKRKVDPKDIYNYCKEPSHWKRDCPKRTKKDYVVALLQNDSSSESNLVMVVGEQLQQHPE